MQKEALIYAAYSCIVEKLSGNIVAMTRLFLTYFPSVLASRLSAFAVVVFGVNLLGQAEYGYFALIIFLGEFLDVSTSNWIRVGILRFGSRSEGVSRAFVIRMMTVSAVTVALAVAFLTGLAAYLAPEAQAPITMAIACYIVANAIYRFGFALHQVLGKPVIASRFELARAGLILAVGVGAMVQTGDYFVVSVASSAAVLALGVVSVMAAFPAARFDLPNLLSFGTLVKFAAPLVFIAILSQIISNLDKALLKIYFDISMVGYAVAAFAVGRAGFDVVANAFNLGVFPKLSALFNEGNNEGSEELLSRQISRIVAVALPMAGMLISLRAHVAMAIFPPAYLQPFVEMIPLIVVGAIALNLKNFVFDNIFHMHLNNIMQVPSLVGGAVTSAAIGWFFLRHSPFFGAGLMFAGGAVVALLISAAVSSKFMRIELRWRSIGLSVGGGVIGWMIGAGLSWIGGAWNSWIILGIGGSIGLLAMAIALLLVHLGETKRSGRLALGFVTTDPDKISGLSSYSQSLIAALASLSDAPRLSLYTNASASILPEVTRCSNVEWRQLPKLNFLPVRLSVLCLHQLANFRSALAGYDAYISTTASGALVPLVPQLFTLHDLYDLDRNFRSARVVVYSRLIWGWLARVSKFAVCVSDTTRSEAIRTATFASAKLRVIKEASQFEAQHTPSYLPAAPMLFVANVAATKNVECLLAALKLAENDGWPVSVNWIGRDSEDIVAGWISQFGPPAGLSALGTVSSEALEHAYKTSSALIVTSWKEGFCLPVLEAQAFGCPVIASDIPILREVAGEGAIFFDPHKPSELYARLQDIRREDLHAKLSDDALINSRQYSWEAAARQFLVLVRSSQ